MLDQFIVFGTLALALVLFVYGRPRYDVVAMIALMVVAVAGLIPASEVFGGFADPAVITVAMVLVVSRGLEKAGLVDMLASWIERFGSNMYVQLGALVGVVTVASAFMNNVGALALTMPVAIRLAVRADRSPSYYLIPIAFASLLGGQITIIGTPPNLIIAGFRDNELGAPFRMFDFAPVGVCVAVVAGAFITFLGWRLLPVRKGQGSREQLFDMDAYLTELVVPEGSPHAGRPLVDVQAFHETDAVYVSLLRGNDHPHMPAPNEQLREGDVLVIEADSETLDEFLQKTGFLLGGSKDHCSRILAENRQACSDVQIGRELSVAEMEFQEAVVRTDSPLIGSTVRELRVRTRFGVNVLAVSRRGERVRSRLKATRFKAGDILLVQGGADVLAEAFRRLACMPIASRELAFGSPRPVLLAAGIFGVSILLTAFNVLHVSISVTLAVLGMLFTGVLTMRDVYRSVEWPVIVLLGAMLPLGTALESTGGADTLAGALLSFSGSLPPAAILTVLCVGTMLLSNLINNAAAAVLMAPIAIGVAKGLGASPDTFLMLTAVACSSPFLTPIGHQSCTLVMGPGGYQFGDYWRVGLPVSVIVTAVAVPAVMFFWPL